MRKNNQKKKKFLHFLRNNDWKNLKNKNKLLIKTVQKKISVLSGATNLARKMSLVLCNVASGTGNDNNNNADNASDDSNPVTIYRYLF